jgi:hypothetical protein
MDKKTSSIVREMKALVKTIEKETKKISSKKQDKQFAITLKTSEQQLLAIQLSENMNKALFNKLTKVSKRPQLKMLDENIALLKQYQEKIRLEDDVSKLNIKVFNQNRKQMRLDNDATYHVYIKAELIKDDGIQVMDNEYFKLMNDYRKLNNTDIDVASNFWRSMVEKNFFYSNITHQTIIVKGKNKIRDEIKDIIDTYMKHGYVIFINLLNVHINKQLLDENDYRWLGAERTGKQSLNKREDGSFASNYNYKVFKAWNAMGFKYHAWNLDINNETPFECVPNALYKVLGNRQSGKFDAKIANGGLEYVKEQLNECNDLDFGLDDDTMNDTKGYTPEDIIKFCNNHKVRCWGFNWKLEQFITNRDSGISFRNDIPSFVFYMNDKHIYLIDDKSLRQSLLKSNNNSDLISILAKEKKKETKDEETTTATEGVVDIPFEDWVKHEKKTIYITKPRLVNDTFYSLIKSGHIYNKQLKLNENDGIVRFEYEKKNTIVYNPDYYDVKKTIDNLNKFYKEQRYTFNNQKLNTLAVEVLEKEFGGYQTSTMNKLGDEIFHSDFIRNTVFNGWLSKPEITLIEQNRLSENTISLVERKVILPKNSTEVKSFIKQYIKENKNKYEAVDDIVNEIINDDISKRRNGQSKGQAGLSPEEEVDEEEISNKIKDCYKNLSGYYLKVDNINYIHGNVFMYRFSNIIYIYNKDKDEYEPIEINTLSSYDYNKHYTSCLMGKDVKFGWPIYNVFDEVKKFDGNLETGYYFVETDNFFPFKGNGWYDADLVNYGCSQDIIQLDNIIHQYKSSKELQPQYFEKFINFVYDNFQNPKGAMNKFNGLFGHDYKNKNIHHFTTDARNVFMELVQNKEAKVKNIYHDEFTKPDKVIDLDDMDVNEYIRKDKPLCYHVYNDAQQKMFNNALPFFYKVYNLSAMKMYQMAQKVGGIVRGIFTDTIIFQGDIKEPELSKEIGGIRESGLKPFTKCISTEPRKGSFKLPKLQYNYIKDFELSDNKSVFITGDAGTGKSYKTNELKDELPEEERVVATPTHKSALIVKGSTIYDVFNINPNDHTYLKSKIEKLKKNGLKWVFIDEVSMINSKVWAVIRDIKRIYKFNFVLVGDFNQLEPVEDITYDVFNSSAFHEICDGQVLKLTKNWRAEACPEFASFIEDLNKIKKGHSIDFSKYGKKECRKSIAWTNRTRKVINNEWMLKESKGKTCYFINNCKVFTGLPIIANETRTYNNSPKGQAGQARTEDIVNNEEFIVKSVNKDTLTITNPRLTTTIKHSEFKYFDLAYCITVHKSQGSTFDFEFTIYDYKFKKFHKKLLYTAMTRATKKSNINFCNRTYKTETGYIYKITNEETNKIYIGSTTTSLEQRFEEHKKSNDNSPLHKAMKEYEKWKIELIEEIEYIDTEELFIAETCQMMKYDSIKNGYNTKLSINYENIY